MPGIEPPTSVRHLIVVLGDQLDRCSAAFDDYDRARDAVLMMEVDEEATWVSQHKARLVLFFSAMRHLRDELRECGVTVHYRALEDEDNRGGFAAEIALQVAALAPERLSC